MTSEAVLLARVGRERSHAIDTYVADGGYEALKKVLTGGWTPESVTEEVKKSGLRGRGGAMRTDAESQSERQALAASP